MSNKSLADKLLSDIVTYRTYAKYMPTLQRRETLSESIDRSMCMHMDRFPKLTDKIKETFDLIHQGAILPSMRGLQFGGPGVVRNNIRQYNCSFHNVDRVEAFAETLYLLLCGTGVGYSVQRHHVAKLPVIHKPIESMYYVVHDSIEGWAMALHALIEAFMRRKPLPSFDFFQIREEGTLLKTAGGRAPGPGKFKKMLGQIQDKLMTAIGRKLTTLEAHDIKCMIADCVKAGGIREAALIALFSRDDQDMLKCKSGEWWVEHPYRGRANNSAVLPRNEVTYEEFVHIYQTLRDNRTGEPGFYWTNNIEWGANPCVEIGLRHKQFCNLTTVNQATVTGVSDLIKRVRAASFLGTLQASYTDFPFLDEEWRRTTELEALIGVSFTGIADHGDKFTGADLKLAARNAVAENAETAYRIGINQAARVTTGKPEGSSSAVLGTSSGMHARKGSADHTYLRRVGLKRGDALTNFLMEHAPELIEESQRDDKMLVVIPQLAPSDAIMYHNERALDTFHRAMKYNINWIEPGHLSGDNKNNMSCTIDVRDEEWDELMPYMWKFRNIYNGLSLFPYDGGTYVQAPFEACDRATYDKYAAKVKEIDFSQIVETFDATEQSASSACAGGACEYK